MVFAYNGVDRPTRLLRFVAFVHLPFSFGFLIFLSLHSCYERHLVLFCKEKIESLDRVANIKRS